MNTIVEPRSHEDTKVLEPVLRFAEFSDDWQPKRLDSLASIQRGKFSPRPRNNPIYYGGEIPFVQTGDVFNSKGRITQNTQTLNEEGLKVSRLFPKGTILITIAANIGYSGVLDMDCACPDSLIGIGVKENSVNYFINYALTRKQPEMDYKADNNAQKNINLEFLKPYQLIVPKKEEQQKIADFLSSVDKKIEQLTEKHRLLTEYKKGVMQQIFTQQIRFKDNQGNGYPEWEYKYGNKVFEAISNKKHNSDLPILAITQDKGAIPRDMIDYKMTVTDASISSYKVVEVGDFIISLRSFQGGIEYSEYKGICSPAYIILRAKGAVNNVFYKNYLKTHNYIQKMNRTLEGIRDGKMISYKYFSEIKIPVPCIEEQQKIANFLTEIDQKIDQAWSTLEQTKAFKKGLLQKMFV